MMSRYDRAAGRFKALSHPVRLQILDMLRGGEVCVCHMEAALGKRQSYISQQLMALREAGLVEARKDGLQVFYRIVDDHIPALLDQVLGPVDVEAAEPLDHCPCPHCSTSSTRLIQIAEPQEEHESHAGH
ncbi:MAG: helix-turn-helix transcriptional regulator [Chloroflexi bacterium]|nr:helix-turn-helix transcriptional regulator [Chloroflexota bacterium]